MNILHTCNVLGEVNGGGSGEVIMQLAKSMNEAGHHASTYTDKARVHLSGSYDIIHIHNHWNMQAIVASKFAIKRGIPYVLQAHGSLPILGKRALKLAFQTLSGKRIINNASKYIAVSHTEVQSYLEYGCDPEKIVCIPNGIDDREYRELPERRTFREKYQISNEDFVILYVGRLAKIKRLEVLLRAYEICKHTEMGIRLVMVGDGNQSGRLKRYVSDLALDRVIFTGALYGLEKREAYAGADVFVLCSEYEVFGITVLEALASGLPVIATSNCGVVDMLPPDSVTVCEGDRLALRLAHCLKTHIRHNDCKKDITQSVRSIVLEEFSWTNITKRILEVYRECLR